MIANGFPNRNYRLPEKQAFYATKMAMDTYLEEWDIEKWTANTSQGGTSEIINVMKQIYNAGNSYTSNENNVLMGVPVDLQYQRYAIAMATNDPVRPVDPYVSEGAKFEFKNLDGEISNIYTTDSNGQIVIDEIPDGDYILNEVKKGSFFAF